MLSIRNLALLTVTTMAIAMLAASTLAAEPLNGQAIKSTIAGKRIYLSTPFGGEIPMAYYKSGKVDASGDAVGLGRIARPKDSGKWWIDGNRLCQQWTSWYDGKVFCFTLERIDEKRLAWVRNDGLKGKARIGGAI